MSTPSSSRGSEPESEGVLLNSLFGSQKVSPPFGLQSWRTRFSLMRSGRDHSPSEQWLSSETNFIHLTARWVISLLHGWHTFNHLNNVVIYYYQAHNDKLEDLSDHLLCIQLTEGNVVQMFTFSSGWAVITLMILWLSRATFHLSNIIHF